MSLYKKKIMSLPLFYVLISALVTLFKREKCNKKSMLNIRQQKTIYICFKTMEEWHRSGMRSAYISTHHTFNHL